MNDDTKQMGDSTQLGVDTTSEPAATLSTEPDAAHQCFPCRTAAERGWWAGSIPNRHTHCRDCHTTFPSSNRWGHCASCHETFSGTVAWDLHQRTSGDGDIRSDCMCGVLTAGAGETAPLGVHHQRKWAVGKSKSLVLHTAEWGAYWAQESDLSHVFRGGAR